jgi:hypothetical protein
VRFHLSDLKFEKDVLETVRVVNNNNNKKISGIVDWECSGYFPAYWEWVIIKRLSATSSKNNGVDVDADDDSSWFELSERRIRPPRAQGKAAWELEQLHKALGKFTQWSLTPEARQANRARGWVEVCSGT